MMVQPRQTEIPVDRFRHETQWKALLHAQVCLIDPFHHPSKVLRAMLEAQ